MYRIAIFASGNGSNAQRIVEYFEGSGFAMVALILSNNENAYVLKRAANLGIPFKTFDRKLFYQSDEVLRWCRDARIDMVVLAGFLWLIPDYFIKAFPMRILNIHPALLPKYGGKGMYGERVHSAVINAGEKMSGITIHYVDERYDNGLIVFQATCDVDKEDTPEMLAHKIHRLEHQYFPSVIGSILKEMAVRSEL